MRLAVCLLALLAASASAARAPDVLSLVERDQELATALEAGGLATLKADADGETIELEGGVSVGQGGYNELEALASEVDPLDKAKWPIRIATKHLVKPESHGTFVRQFWRYQARSEEIKGVKYISLSKVAGDNVVWTSYTVYEDFEALIKHARSEALRDFASFLTLTNIPVQYRLLFRIAGGYHPKAEDSVEPNKRKGWPVRLLTKFIVPPGSHSEFIEEWKRLEAKLGGRKGNIALSLSKPLGDNLIFVSYAAYESGADLWAAARSKASKEFLEYIADKKIVAITNKLWKVPAPKWH